MHGGQRREQSSATAGCCRGSRYHAALKQSNNTISISVRPAESRENSQQPCRPHTAVTTLLDVSRQHGFQRRACYMPIPRIRRAGHEAMAAFPPGTRPRAITIRGHHHHRFMFDGWIKNVKSVSKNMQTESFEINIRRDGDYTNRMLEKCRKHACYELHTLLTNWVPGINAAAVAIWYQP